MRTPYQSAGFHSLSLYTGDWKLFLPKNWIALCLVKEWWMYLYVLFCWILLIMCATLVKKGFVYVVSIGSLISFIGIIHLVAYQSVKNQLLAGVAMIICVLLMSIILGYAWGCQAMSFTFLMPNSWSKHSILSVAWKTYQVDRSKGTSICWKLLWWIATTTQTTMLLAHSYSKWKKHLGRHWEPSLGTHRNTAWMQKEQNHLPIYLPQVWKSLWFPHSPWHPP